MDDIKLDKRDTSAAQAFIELGKMAKKLLDLSNRIRSRPKISLIGYVGYFCGDDGLLYYSNDESLMYVVTPNFSPDRLDSAVKIAWMASRAYEVKQEEFNEMLNLRNGVDSNG